MNYKLLVDNFKNWLSTLNYSASTIYGTPRQLQEFFQYAEQHNINTLKQIEDSTPQLIDQFIEYQKTRKNKRRPGGLSISHINKYLDALNKFNTYIKQSKQGQLTIKTNYLKDDIPPIRTILTIEEIKALYNATDDTPLGQRDKAMLSLCYNCGLRRKEALDLETSDILYDRKLIHIKQTKNNHQRYVPINSTALKHIETYTYQARPLLQSQQEKNNQTLLLNTNGKKLQGQTLAGRLKQLQTKTSNPTLQQKNITLHALRHSIATHLLQQGMELENIARFLGHRTLDSTQVYTHIINQ